MHTTAAVQTRLGDERSITPGRLIARRTTTPQRGAGPATRNEMSKGEANAGNRTHDVADSIPDLQSGGAGSNPAGSIIRSGDALSIAPSGLAERALAEALAAEGVTYEDAFGRTTVGCWSSNGRVYVGCLLRGAGRTALRARIFARMRARRAGGVILSFPEIAAACGLTSHSTVIEALQRTQRRSA